MEWIEERKRHIEETVRLQYSIYFSLLLMRLFNVFQDSITDNIRNIPFSKSAGPQARTQYLLRERKNIDIFNIRTKATGTRSKIECQPLLGKTPKK